MTDEFKQQVFQFREMATQRYAENKDNRISDEQIAAEMTRREIERIQEKIKPQVLTDDDGGLMFPLMAKYLQMFRATAVVRQPMALPAITRLQGVFDFSCDTASKNDPLDRLIDQIKNCWFAGFNDIHLHNLRCINPQFKEQDELLVDPAWEVAEKKKEEQ